MEVLQILGVCLVAVTLTSALELKFKDCGSQFGKVEKLDLSPCTSDPCILHHKQNYTGHITFTALEDCKSPKRQLRGVIGGLSLPFPMNPDACSTGLKCPVKKGEQLVQVTDIYVKPIYPSVRVLAKFILLDDQRRNIFCVVIPVTISH